MIHVAIKLTFMIVNSVHFAIPMLLLTVELELKLL